VVDKYKRGQHNFFSMVNLATDETRLMVFGNTDSSTDIISDPDLETFIGKAETKVEEDVNSGSSTSEMEEAAVEWVRYQVSKALRGPSAVKSDADMSLTNFDEPEVFKENYYEMISDINSDGSSPVDRAEAGWS